MSGLAVIGGVTTAFAGLVIAYTGFSEFSMAVSMPGGSMLLLWMLALGVRMWRGGTAPLDREADKQPSHTT